LSKITQFGRTGRGRTYRERRASRWPVFEFAAALLAVGALAYLALDRGYVSVPVNSAPAVQNPVIQAQFGLCSGSGGTCVIDGDTVRIDGVSVRIADIDTPEVRNYNCIAEFELGRQATTRLVSLLNEGPFELTPYGRDEDQYGRKLRILERNGQSLGMILVAEGLAREWDGARRDWCG
jgi:micrococcal nuclease